MIASYTPLGTFRGVSSRNPETPSSGERPCAQWRTVCGGGLGMESGEELLTDVAARDG
jgi:hypothetical protein